MSSCGPLRNATWGCADPLQRIGNGLESQVTRARLFGGSRGNATRLIVKSLRGRCQRESTMYELLRLCPQSPPTPACLGVHGDGDTEHLYLEDVYPLVAWPGADIDLAATACRALAGLHRQDLDGSRFPAWDYDGELRQSAAETMRLAVTARDSTGSQFWTRVGDLRRVVRALPCMRTRLADERRVVIHGDVHPRNVLVQHDRQRPRIIFIDWARSRYGSPLEDLASWLQSVGCWEPEARRRHDSLFKAYLRAYDSSLPLSASTRRLYWYAAASNGLAGAIGYHLAALGNPQSPDRVRSASSVALRDWQRVIRRAAALV